MVSSKSKQAKRPRKSTDRTETHSDREQRDDSVERESQGGTDNLEAVLRAYHKKQVKKEATQTKKLKDDLALLLESTNKRVDATTKAAADKTHQAIANVNFEPIDTGRLEKANQVAQRQLEMSNMAEQDIKQQIESTLLDQEIEECAGKLKDTNQDLKKQSKKTLRRIEYATVSLEDAAQTSIDDLSTRYKHLKAAFA